MGPNDIERIQETNYPKQPSTEDTGLKGSPSSQLDRVAGGTDAKRNYLAGGSKVLRGHLARHLNRLLKALSDEINMHQTSAMNRKVNGA